MNSIIYNAECFFNLINSKDILESKVILPPAKIGETKKTIELSTHHNGLAFFDIIYPEKYIRFTVAVEMFLKKYGIDKSLLDICLIKPNSNSFMLPL